MASAALLGQFDEAERLAAGQRAINDRLTAHHRVHGVAVQAEVAEMRGSWERLLQLQPEVVERVEANLGTPCVRNARTLLLLALAHEYSGDALASQELEQRARELWMEGHGVVIEGVALKLALARGDLREVERLCDPAFLSGRPSHNWFFVSGVVAHLDGLAALRRVEQLEQVIAVFSRPGSLLEPHAWRALGFARDDRGLLERSAARFEALGLDWYARQARGLMA